MEACTRSGSTPSARPRTSSSTTCPTSNQAPARCASPSRPAACTCSTPRSGAASPDRSRHRSCPPSRVVRSRASWTTSARTPTRAWLGERVVAHLGPVPGGYAEQAVTAVDKLFPVPDHVSLPDAVAAVGTGRTALGVVELEPAERGRRGPGAVGRRWAGLAAGAVGAGSRCDGGRGRSRRTHGDARGTRRPPRRRLRRARLGREGPRGDRRRQPGLRRRGRRGRATVPRAAEAGRPAGHVRLLGGDPHPADHRRPDRPRGQRRLVAGRPDGGAARRHPGARRPGARTRWPPASGDRSSRRTRWPRRPGHTPTWKAAGRSARSCC